MPNMGETIALIKALGGSGGGGSGIIDVQVNGTSVVSDGVANIIPSTGLRTSAQHPNTIMIAEPNIGDIRTAVTNKTLRPADAGTAVFYGLARVSGDVSQAGTQGNVGTYTESAKSAISTMLHAPESVTGTTPTITAMAGVQYVCGEVSTLDITLPASGCVDVRFESGSTPTVLTITPPSGVTVKWAGGFDPTALDANTVYEINIADGLGVAASWT